VSPPDVSLSMDTVLAAVKIPIKTLTNRLADRADAELVRRMYDELKETGTVEKNLTEDDRAVRELHAAEVLHSADRPRSEAAPSEPAAERSAAPKATVSPRLADRLEAASADAAPRAPTPRLNLADDVVNAPSIGPRMAERLEAIGIKTVADLLHSEPGTVAEGLRVSYVKAADVADWQAQARLVTTVPGLTGTGAQLLVGAGFREPAAIAAAEPDQILALVLSFAQGSAGKRVLRDGKPPGGEQIKEWAENSRRALAA
jgi:predicted flap endonuclease-1-like 5' DNA nuclease